MKMKNKILSIFLSALCVLTMGTVGNTNTVQADSLVDTYTETWYGYAQGGRPTYQYPVSSVSDSKDRFGNGINVYKWYYSAKTTRTGSTRNSDFPSKNTAGGVVLNSWNTGGKDWHITSFFSDVDVCKKEGWTNYYQPKVTLRCNGRDVLVLQTESDNIQQNGSGSNLNVVCNGTIEQYSYGNTGDGRNGTYVGGGNGFDYYYEETTSGKVSDWGYQTSQLSGFTSIDGVYSTAYKTPTLSVVGSSFKNDGAYSLTTMIGNYYSSNSIATVPLQMNIIYHSNGADSGSVKNGGANQNLASIKWSKTGYSRAASLYFDSAGTQEAVNMDSYPFIIATNLQTRISSNFNYNTIYYGSWNGSYIQGSNIDLYAKWLPCNFNINFVVKDPNDATTQKTGSDLSVSYNGNTYYGSSSFTHSTVKYDTSASSLNFTNITNTNAKKYKFLGWYDANGNRVIDENGYLINNTTLISNYKFQPSSSLYTGEIAQSVSSNTTGDSKTITLYGRWKFVDNTPPTITSSDLDSMMDTCSNGGWYNNSTRNDPITITITDLGTDGGDPTGVVRVELYELYGKDAYSSSKSLSESWDYSPTETVEIPLTVQKIANLNAKLNEWSRNNYDQSSQGFHNKFYIKAYDANGNSYEREFDIPCIDFDSPYLYSSSSDNKAGFNDGNKDSYTILCDGSYSYSFSTNSSDEHFTIGIKTSDKYNSNSNGYFTSKIDPNESYVVVEYYNKTTKKWVQSEKSYFEKLNNTGDYTAVFSWSGLFKDLTNNDSASGSGNPAFSSNYPAYSNYINLKIHLQDYAGNTYDSGKLISDLYNEQHKDNWESYKPSDWSNNTTNGFCKIVSNAEVESENNALVDFGLVFKKYKQLGEDANKLYEEMKAQELRGGSSIESMAKAYEYLRERVANGETVEEAMEDFKTQYHYGLWKSQNK